LFGLGIIHLKKFGN